MKIKLLGFIAFAAIITLSFSFAASSRSQKMNAKENAAPVQVTEPIRGFISEDKL